jgi:hypothetical protein
MGLSAQVRQRRTDTSIDLDARFPLNHRREPIRKD